MVVGGGGWGSRASLPRGGMEGREYMGDVSAVIVYVFHTLSSRHLSCSHPLNEISMASFADKLLAVVRVCCFFEHLLRNLENGTVISKSFCLFLGGCKPRNMGIL